MADGGKLLARVLTVGGAVVAAQGLLGTFINGLFPQVTGFSLGFFSVGSIATAAIGVWVGEMLYTRFARGR